MLKKTINEAIIEALKREGKPLRVSELYKRIKEDDLYRFNASNPEHIVRTQVRRHSDNLNFPTAHKTKHFVFLNDGTYWIKGLAHKESENKEVKLEDQSPALDEIKSLHKTYVTSFKQVVLKRLIQLEPYSFEIFCKKLLEVYGFKNVKVTQKTRDGGIDGFGELQIGFAYFSVAFECKRYSQTNVNHKLVNQFRGAISGKSIQGIYFTTSSFTKSAKEVSFQQGALPIILIDGLAIVDIMIEKGLGIEKELLLIYSNVIDLVLDNDKED